MNVDGAAPLACEGSVPIAPEKGPGFLPTRAFLFEVSPIRVAPSLSHRARRAAPTVSAIGNASPV